MTTTAAVKINRAEVMKRAWQIFKAKAVRTMKAWSESLRSAWKFAKGGSAVMLVKQKTGQFYDIQMHEVNGKYFLKLGKVGILRSESGFGGEVSGMYVEKGPIMNRAIIDAAFDEYVELAEHESDWQTKGTVLKKYYEDQTAALKAEIKDWKAANLSNYTKYTPKSPGYTPEEEIESRERLVTFSKDGASFGIGGNVIFFDKCTTPDGRVFIIQSDQTNGVVFYADKHQVDTWKEQLVQYLGYRTVTYDASTFNPTTGKHETVRRVESIFIEEEGE